MHLLGESIRALEIGVLFCGAAKVRGQNLIGHWNAKLFFCCGEVTQFSFLIVKLYSILLFVPVNVNSPLAVYAGFAHSSESSFRKEK